MQYYTGDPPFSKDETLSLKDHGCSVHRLHIGTHTGTHIDAPCHFTQGGQSVDQLDLSSLLGPALVIDVGNLSFWEEIKPKHLDRYISELNTGSYRIVLIRTGWCKYWKTPEYAKHPYLTKATAEKLMELGVKVIGVDTLSPDKTPEESKDFCADVHHCILGQGGYIVENLKGLDRIADKPHIVSLLPLKIVGVDGSPIRATPTLLLILYIHLIISFLDTETRYIILLNKNLATMRYRKRDEPVLYCWRWRSRASSRNESRVATPVIRYPLNQSSSK